MFESAWPRRDIDRFILRRLRAEKLEPSREADRRTLIRRIYFDLLGLPPSPEAVRKFVADNDPRAYERLVDELLAVSAAPAGDRRVLDELLARGSVG